MAIDWDILDYENEFELLEAAFYWCGLDPNESEITDKVEAVHRALKNYVKVEVLKIPPNFDISPLVALGLDLTPPPQPTHISRKQLIAYANGRGFKPAFLFPDARNNEDKLNGNERNTYLRLIAALLQEKKLIQPRTG